MPTFKYVVRDRSGKASSGVLEAGSVDELRRTLRANDLYLTSYKGGGTVEREDRAQANGLFQSAKPNLQDLVICCRQLSTLIRAGVPLAEGLEIVRVQSTRPLLQLALRDIQQGVIEGESISAGMRKHPSIFNDLVVSLVEAGETAGTLDTTLEVASEQLDREDELRRQVKQATFYPKLVIAASIGTVALMLILVVPVFADVYRTLNAELPTITTLLIKISDVVVHWWWVVGLVCGALYYLFLRYKATPGGHRRLDIISLKIPVIGSILRKIAIARICQTLAGALKGGVPVLRSLSIAGNTAGNVVLRDAVMTVAHHVRDGASIGVELERSGEFPVMVTRMIEAGESMGNIDEMLSEINRFYERDVEYAVARLTRLIEPVMTIVVGALVLFVLLALYMPIFNLGRAFRESTK